MTIECSQSVHSIVYYSANEAYYGRLISTNHVNVGRQRKQAAMSEELKSNLARKMIDAKIRNQCVILRRYTRNGSIDTEKEILAMQNLRGKLLFCKSVEEIMGYEGAAARIYFSTLGKLIDSEFTFSGRNKRPPLDPFNSMISLGYSIILNEIYGKLEGKGLNPYFGILHKDREKHPTLASDMMEEWRAVLLDKEGFKNYIGKLENKFHADQKYLSYIDYRVSFRRALDLQVNQLTKAIEENDASLYMPVVIR